MALQKVTHIEGLDAFQDVDLSNDNDPGAMIIRFEVVSEELTNESALQGKIVRKNFVHIYKEWEVGHTSFRRRIRDRVEFDEAAGKWKVIQLAHESKSDIMKHPAEWNAFALGTATVDVGTPLSVLFKADPSRVLMYKDRHITTVERLAGVNQTDAQLMGMGVYDDVQKAQAYIARLGSLSNQSGVAHKIDDQQHQIAVLQRTIEELKAKLDEKPEIENKPKRGRPAKKAEAFDESAFAP